MEEESFNKKEWVNTYKKNNREFNSEFLSRFKPLIIFKKDFTSFIDDSNREADKLQNKFVTYRKNKVKEISEIKGQVQQAKKMKERIYDDETVIDKLQKSVRDINDTLKTFKIKSKNEYAKLAQDEEVLTQELQLFEQKFDAILEEETEAKTGDRGSVISGTSYRGSVSSAGKRRPASVAGSQKSRASVATSKLSRRPGIPLPPTNQETDEVSQHLKLEISQIDDEISALGGFHCGWPPGDHEDFLRVKTKHKHKTETLSFLNEILGLVPDCTVDKVKEHVKVHKEYLELCKTKKELLQKYKQHKIVLRNTKLQRLETAGAPFQENDRHLVNRTNSASRSVGKVNQFSKEYRERQKSQIKQWKQKKEEEEEQKRKEAKERKQKLIEARKEKQREEQEWKAHKVKQYQIQKQLKEEQKKEMQMLEKRKRKQAAQDQETKERIFKREEELFRKRAELVITKKCVEEEQMMRLERQKFLIADSKYDKVESRLNKQTKAAQGKQRKRYKEGIDEKKDAMTFGGQLIGPSMRAQPQWRKGI